MKTCMAVSENKKEQLLQRFDFAKKQNLDLMEEIEQYARDHNAFDTPFMQGYTFKTGIQALQKERDVVFNDENRKVVLTVDEDSNELDYLITKIEDQINHYGEMKMGLNIYFKSIN
ncbi:MAG: hypothetical protein E6H06_13195 [Bacteroidetes bacterium]|nr:MAG: hypothetical protein E6H06_13195 [Bacteroidota bacterium]